MLFRRLQDLPATLQGEWRELLPALEPLRRAAQDAQRIVFARTAALACLDLAAGREQLEKARRQIFAPFHLCWIEMEGVPGVAALWRSDQTSMQRGSLLLLTWPADHPTPVVYDMDADIDSLWRPPFLLREASRQALLNAGSGVRDPYVGTAEETGEWIAAPILAAFALLATKGLTGSHETDMSKLNRARAKAGKYPLLGYQEIRLNLDADRVVREQHAASKISGTMPQHYVRAHLRLLPTGRVTIVRAHIRGNPEHGVRRSHYLVERDEDVIDRLEGGD